MKKCWINPKEMFLQEKQKAGYYAWESTDSVQRVQSER